MLGVPARVRPWVTWSNAILAVWLGPTLVLACWALLTAVPWASAWEARPWRAPSIVEECDRHTRAIVAYRVRETEGRVDQADAYAAWMDSCLGARLTGRDPG